MLRLAPSILAADFTSLGQQIKEAAEAGASYIHIDVMDGFFVPAISLGMPVIRSIRKVTDKPFDVHLMIEKPERYVEEFRKCGADMITFHLEASGDPGALISQIHSLGARAGISIKPQTPVEEVVPYLKEADMVLVMSVHPGFGGQEFLPESPERIRQIKSYIDAWGLKTDVEVDGGIYLENVREVIKAGANIMVAGSAVFKGNVTQNIKAFLKVFQEVQTIGRID